MSTSSVLRIESARLEARRPRRAGSNARLGDHGLTFRPPVVQVTTDSGAAGFGWAHVSPEQARAALGQPITELFSSESGPQEAWRDLEYPLWDLAAREACLPVYALAARMTAARSAAANAVFSAQPFFPRGARRLSAWERMRGPHAPPGSPEQTDSFRVCCYDTSLYFDDLDLTSDTDAATLIAEEARQGYERGHRAFKIKVGRGARHLPLDQGTARDIAIVHAVRDAIGPGHPILLDANNGYNLNLTKRVLSETRDAEVFWMEEPFHEDPVLYRDLGEWLEREGIRTLIADGEGEASPRLRDWAREGLVDAIQYDVLSPGFTRWLEIGRELDASGILSAPHHYGGFWGNFTACHLAAAIQGFTFAEWDEASIPAVDTSPYQIEDGWVHVPAAPGFGLSLDEDRFRASEGYWRVE